MASAFCVDNIAITVALPRGEAISDRFHSAGSIHHHDRVISYSEWPVRKLRNSLCKAHQILDNKSMRFLERRSGLDYILFLQRLRG